MSKVLLLALVTLCCLVFADTATAQAKQRVNFARGSSSATVRGTVRGYAYHDYVVRASAGQALELDLRSTHTYAVFSVLRPDGDNLEDAAERDNFIGELPTSGDYVIRVGMMRSGARRPGSVSNFTLTISIR
ncbi:MAG TPA: hypothetical protein VHL50_05275 [Pyrinomonadaceae bacterium]|jgi:hypothetical protein|nr:hypothetical protein [Pyrinomonadaceae bacterium]